MNAPIPDDELMAELHAERAERRERARRLATDDKGFGSVREPAPYPSNDELAVIQYFDFMPAAPGTESDG